MKKTADNLEVPDRVWYYLLDWNDADTTGYMKTRFGKPALHSLTKREVMKLFRHATETDLYKITDWFWKNINWATKPATRLFCKKC